MNLKLSLLSLALGASVSLASTARANGVAPETSSDPGLSQSDGTPPTLYPEHRRHHEPRRFRRGHYPWRHWGYHGGPRPIYADWRWERLRSVSCTAVDSRGDDYNVIEEGYVGRDYRNSIEAIQDAALDRCFEESGGDQNCRLESCQPVY